MDSSAAAGGTGRAAGSRLSPPGRGRWQGQAPRRAVGAGALPPSGRGDSSGLPPPSPPLGCSLSFRPPFCPSRSLLSPLHGTEGEGRGGPRGAGARRGRAAAGAGTCPCPPGLGAARRRCRCSRWARRSPGAGRSSRGPSGLLRSPASTPVSAGTPGWLLAARRAADGLLGLLVLLSLSLPSPVVVCLSTTFRPAHYNAGERRSQDKDLKGRWVEKQGSKGGYALISRIRAVISQDDSEVLLESYFTKLVCIFSCQVPPLTGYFERSRSSARLSRAGPPPRCKMQNDL